ncbi:uncharacterized protein LOC18103878 isoform X3 [Populus trichocarpa]|uniref:uncharacterized protein LOC18103878 isoform X3 n=1 Tax=Populus trichocarpa TaxID=3694 RepID=UPI002277F65B|nr:uncharacterized protein LOC18103878 isoform X3 [Populus trichocarpa]
MMADQGGKSLIREYKKGNWTVSETMVLIEAKRMDDERRMKRSDSAEGRSKPTELRWKWVEDYCWKQECLRSQNQCNDKWDNLMRDYKKVRDYERKIAETGERNGGSYWKLEKNERKERNLPSNMLPQIYEELVEVVERRGGQQRMLTAAGGSGSNPNTTYVVERPITDVQPSVLPPLLQHQVSAAPTPALPLPPPCPPPSQQPQAQPPPPIQFPEPFPTVAKRRRRGGGGGEGTSGGTASASTSHEVGTAISKSASIIAEAIQACDEREERRHRDLLGLHERRLKIEESKTEINRQGISGLVDAINKLANSILALASHKNQSSGPK